MWEDPIVQEVRDARAKNAEQFNFDLRAIYEDFKKQEKQSGRKIVSYPPNGHGAVGTVISHQIALSINQHYPRPET